MKYLLIILCIPFTLFSQEKKEDERLQRQAREYIRQGNKMYNSANYADAEVAFKKALEKAPESKKAAYNLGNAVYQQDRNKEAVKQFGALEKILKSKDAKAEAYHNLGNSLMNEKQYAPAIDAYKKALRNNPKDDETRYNLALAQEKLKEQQKKDDKKKDDKKDDKNKDKNKDNKDKKKDKDGDKDDKKKDDKKDKDDKGDDKKKDQPKDKDKDKEEQKPQKRPSQLSPEQMKQLLEAMNNEENKTQKKLNAKKARGRKVKQQKDW